MRPSDLEYVTLQYYTCARISFKRKRNVSATSVLVPFGKLHQDKHMASKIFGKR